MFLNNLFNTDSEKDEDEDFYSVLGCSSTASAEQILAEYRIRALRLHPDKAQSEQDRLQRESKFCQLSQAKEVLTDVAKRQNYDRWKESGLKIPYKKWCSLSNQCHTSIHWMNSKRNAPKAITDHGQIETERSCRERPGSSYPIESLRSFRHGESQDGRVFSKPMNTSGGNTEDRSEILNMFRNYQI